MDRVYKIRRASREMASTYIPGDCHICQQSNVKVRRLKCGMHNFCRMCYEFEPRLARGDFSCKVCTDKVKTRITERKYSVDSFFSRHAGVKEKHTETTVSTNGNKIIEFGGTVAEEENDLEGYNTEWDHLLQSTLLSPVTSITSTKYEQSEVNEKIKKQPALEYIPRLQKIPKKSSYIHLVMPTAKTDCNCFENETAPQPIANTVTELLDSEIPKPSKSKSSSGSSINCASLRSVFGSGIITKPKKALATFQTDPTELERETSPCKGIRLQKSYVWSDDAFSIDPSYSETEQMMEQIGTIEGPAFTSSSCSSSASGSDGIGSESSAINIADEGFWD